MTRSVVALSLLTLCFTLEALGEADQFYYRRSGKCTNRHGQVGYNSVPGECSSLDEADYFKKNLAGFNFRGSSLVNANFGGANLEGADLSGANLIGANLFQGCRLKGAIFDEFTQSSFDTNTLLKLGMVKIDYSKVDIKLLYAVRERNFAEVESLLKKRADPTPALDRVSNQGDAPILELLFTYGADPNAIRGGNSTGHTYFAGTLLYSDFSIIELFLKFGADPYLRLNDQEYPPPFRTLLMRKYDKSRDDLVQLYDLIQTYRPFPKDFLNTPFFLNSCSELPLWQASHPDVILKLIQDGAKLNAEKTSCKIIRPDDHERFFLFHLLASVASSYFRITPDYRDSFKTLFRAVLEHGDLKLSDLVPGGAVVWDDGGKQIRYKLNYYEEAMRYSFSPGSFFLEASKILKEIGALETVGERPLMFSWMEKKYLSEEAFTFLRSLGASPDVRDLNGNILLIKTLRYMSRWDGLITPEAKEYTKLMLKLGANPASTDRNNQTAPQYCEMYFKDDLTSCREIFDSP